MTLRTTYIAIDIEADGPCPGLHSMLSLGAVAYNEEGTKLDEYYRVFGPLEGATVDSDTEKWWKEQSDAIYCSARTDAWDADKAMLDFSKWIQGLDGVPVAVMAPVGFDWTFLYYYFNRFGVANPFGFRTVDVRQMIAEYIGVEYPNAKARDLPKAWKNPDLPHTHHALDDAKGIGDLFCKLKNALKTRPRYFHGSADSIAEMKPNRTIDVEICDDPGPEAA